MNTIHIRWLVVLVSLIAAGHSMGADSAVAAPATFAVKPAWMAELGKVAEGSQITLGAYNRPWR